MATSMKDIDFKKVDFDAVVQIKRDVSMQKIGNKAAI